MADSIPGGLTAPPLLVLLSDGEVRSGESLAQQLGQTRAAVWKGVERLRALGIGVQALARRGYRLTEPIELLQADRLLRELSAPSRPLVRNLEILFEVDSTSTRLLAAAKPPPIGVAVVIFKIHEKVYLDNLWDMDLVLCMENIYGKYVWVLCER